VAPAAPPTAAARVGALRLVSHRLRLWPSPGTYVVRSGDTLSGIARQFYGDAKRRPEIQKANGITNPNLVHTGDRLTIP
jgi:nucleoid-associated protein YgaU